ncbi:hypothetical protein IYX23_11180 [Methylocystis sp. L43]|jgi:hypothetical protein|uniref:hypothetical protein n=1 Tax=unclassified Methylocystis TaxID=2625913 RepID=UPI0018C21D3A|nr:MULTISPECIES: hypothetical protein [unclassified Methylocystis]MBG0798230.1 hypothetical protein [Methylocystis sp. L43]MBG0805685.1 hypothetical protein [Methylocystis sp. H15]
MNDSSNASSKFETREQLEAWFMLQPREVATVIASRAALRTIWANLGKAVQPRDIDSQVAGRFRAAALARGATINFHAVSAFTSDIVNGSIFVDTVAAYTAYTASSQTKDALASSASGATYGAYAIYALEYDYAYGSDVWDNTIADLKVIENGGSAKSLLRAPLWPTKFPRWASDSWKRLKQRLSAEAHWDVWINWYEDRISGRLDVAEYELAFASVPSEIWNQGPAVANRWIKEHLPKGDAAEWTSALSTMLDAPIGQRWIEEQGLLAIDAKGVDSDFAAAEEVPTKNLHALVRQKAQAFAARCSDFDDRYGWEGFESAAMRFCVEVDRDISEIPSRIVFVYDACAVLGGFLDQDNRLREQRNSNIAPLDADIRREFFDLIRTAAPWVRSFPTARELDDQAGAYLARRELFEPATTIINSAGEKGIISEQDRALISALIKTLEQEGYLSGKAHARGLLATKGMVLKAFTLVAAFYSGAVSSDFATRSVLVQKIGTVMAAREEQVIKLLEDAPHDIRLAIKAALEELKRNPPGSAKH